MINNICKIERSQIMQLKEELSTQDIEIFSIVKRKEPYVYFARVKLPYSNASYGIEFEGMDYEQLKENLMSNINQQIETMIDHLGDCKL